MEKMLKALQEYVSENYKTIGTLGIRTQNNDEIATVSYHWDNETDCSSKEEMPGICTIGLVVNVDYIENFEEALALALTYGNKYLFIVEGDNAGGGDGDNGEVVIANAKAILQRIELR